jgi:hypothetical protein
MAKPIMQLARAVRPCKLHDSPHPELLIHRRRSGWTDPMDFIHVRFWDLIVKVFQSITGGGTLLASSSASDTDGGGTECAQTFS